MNMYDMEEPLSVEQKLTVTREQFEAYERIRKLGKFNMIMDARQASTAAGLDLTEYLNVMAEYNLCVSAYGKVKK